MDSIYNHIIYHGYFLQWTWCPQMKYLICHKKKSHPATCEACTQCDGMLVLVRFGGSADRSSVSRTQNDYNAQVTPADSHTRVL